jgi:Gas vesicle synthesis protein GvpL/GvpF
VTDLADWARGRAPELLKRAEQEAVAMLRDALVDAALGDRVRAPDAGRRREQTVPPAAAATPRKRAEQGHALWAYCVLRAGDPIPDPVPGVDPEAPVQPLEDDGLVVLISRVPLAEFGEDPLRENLNDLSWLERVARAHEAVLESALGGGPIVPLRLCTIFADEAGVRAMLAREGRQLREALERLDGRREWGVKLLVDRAALAAAARTRSPEVAALQDELAERSGGGAYMHERKLERLVGELVDRLAAELAEDVHARLGDWAADSVLNPPQNRELSGHEGEMILNGAYLVETKRTEGLRRLLSQLEERHRELGARLELTGPWPPYNFVSREAGAPA